jgi:hypothetical protein
VTASIERTGEEVGLHPSRLDDLETDPELTQLERHPFAPAFEGPFRRVVHRIERDGDEAAD